MYSVLDKLGILPILFLFFLSASFPSVGNTGQCSLLPVNLNEMLQSNNQTEKIEIQLCNTYKKYEVTTLLGTAQYYWVSQADEGLFEEVLKKLKNGDILYIKEERDFANFKKDVFSFSDYDLSRYSKEKASLYNLRTKQFLTEWSSGDELLNVQRKFMKRFDQGNYHILMAHIVEGALPSYDDMYFGLFASHDLIANFRAEFYPGHAETGTAEQRWEEFFKLITTKGGLSDRCPYSSWQDVPPLERCQKSEKGAVTACNPADYFSTDADPCRNRGKCRSIQFKNGDLVDIRGMCREDAQTQTEDLDDIPDPGNAACTLWRTKNGQTVRETCLARNYFPNVDADPAKNTHICKQRSIVGDEIIAVSARCTPEQPIKNIFPINR